MLYHNVHEANAYPSPELNFVRGGDITISAEQAAYLSENCVHTLQKQIRPLTHTSAQQHIAVHAAIMQSPGAWMQRTQIRFGVLHGRLYIMDGNHRIAAQAMSGVSIEWNAQVDFYETEAEFRSAFHKFNTNTRVRTESQILSNAGFAEEMGISKTSARAVYNAMPIILGGFRTGKFQADVLKTRVVDTRLEMASRFAEEARMFDACLENSDRNVKRRIVSGGICAVALVTLQAHPDRAWDFWDGVARNDGLSKGDPRHAFVMDMFTRNLSKGAAHQAYAAAAFAWNAWYAGKELKIIRVVGTDAVRIAGTKYRG